jgi:hypothetical protein
VYRQCTLGCTRSALFTRRVLDIVRLSRCGLPVMSRVACRKQVSPEGDCHERSHDPCESKRN